MWVVLQRYWPYVGFDTGAGRETKDMDCFAFLFDHPAPLAVEFSTSQLLDGITLRARVCPTYKPIQEQKIMCDPAFLTLGLGSRYKIGWKLGSNFKLDTWRCITI